MGDANWLESDWQGRCGAVSDYEKIQRIGEGTYGYVYSAIHKTTREVVALKRIILHHEQQDGFPLTSIREIKTLRKCAHHKNIVQLRDVVVGPRRDAVFLLFEHCDMDLEHICRHHVQTPPFKESEIKCLCLQLLEAVDFLHQQWIVHRDIKLSNLLYHRGLLKLADFGLARTLSQPPPANLTGQVVTLWYRAPELLLGAATYSFAVDLWSVGCVLGDLLASQPIMQGGGDSELHQVLAIFQLLGCPSEAVWPGLTQLLCNSVETGRSVITLEQWEREQARWPYNRLGVVLPQLGGPGLDLVQGLLTYCPQARLTARQARRHAYFTDQAPRPVLPALLPAFPHLLRSTGTRTSSGSTSGRGRWSLSGTV